MSSVITQTGATETVVAGPIVDSNSNPLTGLTSIKAAVFRASDLTFLDWSTMGFTATPVTLYQALTELDSARAPGIYYLKINTSSFTGVSANDRYFASVSQQGASSAVNALQMGEFRVGTIVDKVETNLDTNVGSRAKPGDPANALLRGTAGAGGANTITLTGGVATDNYYRRSLVMITAGTGAGQAALVLAYVGSTNVATVAPSWTTAPDNTSVFSVIADSSPILKSSGVLQATTSFTATLSASSSTVDNTYQFDLLFIHSGAGAGQVRQIASYVGATQIATLYTAWTTFPDTTSAYEILPFGISVTNALASGSITSASLASGSITSAALASSAITAIQGTMPMSLAELLAVTVATLTTAGSGCTSTTVTSAATQGDGFYNGQVLIVVNAAGTAARRILSYVSASGTFTLDSALPFTPSSGDHIAVVARPAPLSSSQTEGAVWDAATSAHTGAGSYGLAVGANLDTNVGSRAAPGAAMALTSGERTATAAAVWNALAASYTTSGSFGAFLGSYAAAPTAAAVAAAVWGTAGGLTSAVLAASAVTALQAGMATSSALAAVQTTLNTVSAGLTSLQSHGDSTWATVTGFATNSALSVAQTSITAIQGSGFVGGVDDLHSAHALLSGASTGTALSAAVAAINSHTDGATSPLATATGLTSVGNAVANTPSLVWEEILIGHTTVGTYGLLVATALPLIDVAVSTRAVPGAAMALVGGAIAALQSAILSDAIPFAGAAIAALPGTILNTALAGHTTAGTVGAALGAASPAGIAAAVWATSEAGAPGTFGYGLWALRMGMTNKMGVTAPGTMVVYGDDNATPFLTWSGVRDGTGQPITLPVGEPAQRLKAG